MILADSVLPWDTVVKILGIGLSGLGFLLMYLAFQLIREVMSAPAANKQVFSIIRTYMLLCFVMTMTVGVFTVINTVYKNNALDKQANQLTQQSEQLTSTATLLAANQKTKTVSDTILKSRDTRVASAAKREQRKALGTIGNFVAQTQKKPVIDSFNKYRAIVISSTDTLTRIDTANPKGRAKYANYKKKYEQANNAIDKLTSHVASTIIKK